MKKRFLAVLLLLAAGIALLCYTGRFRSYTTAEAYQADGGRDFILPPEEAESCRFLQRRLIFSKLYMSAFTLPADAAAQFEAGLTEKYSLNTPEPAKGSPAYWYGRTAGECADESEGLDAFPLHLPFSRLTDRDINGAKVIVYSPAGTGGRTCGILTFPGTQEYICVEYLSR